MSDMSEDFKAMNDVRKEKHSNWKVENLKLIDEAKLRFVSKNDDETLEFVLGKTKIHFYPSTGRWTTVPRTKTFSGGGKAFLVWYVKRQAEYAQSTNCSPR